MVIFEELEQERLDAMIEAVLHKHWGKVSSARLEAEDLRQEMLLKVFRVLPQYDPACGASVYVFCQAACENRLLDLLRRAAKTARCISLDDAEDGDREIPVANEDLHPDAVPLESIVNLVVGVEKARRSLTPEDRALFDMLLNGMSQKEIGRELGCTQPAVNKRVKALRSALSWLKEDLRG